MAANNGDIMNPYEKVQKFLFDRQLDYLLPSFVLNKVDDSVAHNCTDSKLGEIGLMYGDVLAFRTCFGPENQTADNMVKTYAERAKELKQSLKRKHTGRINANNKPVTIKPMYNVVFNLKCYEKNKYGLKLRKGFEREVGRSANYKDIHDLCREFYGVPDNVKTFIGSFEKNLSLENEFSSVEKYAEIQKDKKKKLHLYFYVPISFKELEFKKLLKNVSDGNENDLMDDFDIPDDILSTEFPKICSLCSCTYTGDNCIRCEQNVAFQECLLNDQQKENLSTIADDSLISLVNNVTNTDVTDDEKPTHEDVRKARLRHFTKPPIRYRHSIGSPSLDLHGNHNEEKSMDYDESAQNDTDIFGEEEVTRFFESEVDEEAVTSIIDINSSGNDSCKENPNQFLKAAMDIYQSNHSLRTSKTIIVQREKSKFWSIIFLQKFNLIEHNMTVRFAGEAAADAGGPYREFLTLCMKNFGSLSNVIFGNSSKVCFSGNTEKVLDGTYFKLGQLVGISIVSLGRGPECIHPAIVRNVYGIEQPNIIEPVDDAKIITCLNNIDNREFDDLLDMDINPAQKTVTELKKLFLLASIIVSKAAAINQFKDGVASISSNLILRSSYSIMRLYLEESVGEEYSFDDMVKLICYPQQTNSHAGSNDFKKYQDAITEFELLLAALENKEFFIGKRVIKFNDLLYFITGADRVPPHGFEKLIDIMFDDVSLPKANTCGLSAVFPYNGMSHGLKIALEFGGGFGNI